MKKTFISILIVCLLLTGCDNSSILTQESQRYLKDFLETNQHQQVDFSVETYEKYYIININGETTLMEIPQLDYSVDSPVFPAEEVKTEIPSVEKAREAILKYIDKSKVLEEKERIKRFINDVKIFTVSENELSKIYSYGQNSEKIEAFRIDNNIYINKSKLKYIKLHTIIHEFVHLIAIAANNKPHNSSLFNEILTDIIAAQISGKDIEDSFYGSFRGIGYVYIGIFGENQALKSYFYQQQSEIIDKSELDFFIYCVDGLTETTIEQYNFANFCIGQMLLKWSKEVA